MDIQAKYNEFFQYGRCKVANMPQGMLPPPLVTKQELIELLKEDVSLEYQAAIQYIQHYSMIQGAAYDAIRAHLKEHAEQEIDHAFKIADRINFMGGVVPVSVPQVKVAPDTVGMLKLDLEDEKTAVRRYKERIMQAMSIGEFGLVDVLQDILEDEEEHQSDLETTLSNPKGENFIGDVGQSPVENYQPIMAGKAGFRENREQRTEEIKKKLIKLAAQRYSL